MTEANSGQSKVKVQIVRAIIATVLTVLFLMAVDYVLFLVGIPQIMWPLLAVIFGAAVSSLITSSMIGR